MITITMDKDKVNFSGELSIHILEGLRKKLDEVLDVSKGDLVLNFNEVSSIDAAALQLLLSFKKSAEKKVKVKVININPNLLRIIKISGLEKSF